MYDRAPIRQAAASGLSVEEIAEATGITTTTVRRALDLTRPATYHRPSSLDAIGPQVREVLARYPRMKAPAVAYRIGWTGSMRTLRHVVATVRAEIEKEA